MIEISGYVPMTAFNTEMCYVYFNDLIFYLATF